MSHTDELMLGEDIDCSLIKDAAPFFVTVDAVRKFLSLCRPDEMATDTKEMFDSRLKSISKAHRMEIKNSDDNILSLNEGATVLYGAYRRAKENNQADVCTDIIDHLKGVAPVYQQKVYSDFVSLCNFILNASVNSFDTPVLHALKDVRRSLKKQNSALMAVDNHSKGVADFWQAVEQYAQTMDIDVRELPTLKVASSPKTRANTKIMTRC